MERESPERRMVRGSGLENSMRILSSFLRNHMWPDSVEVSFTTSVYLMLSILAVRVRKSRAPASIMSSTESAVHFCADCARAAGAGESNAAKINAKKKPGLLVKVDAIPCGFGGNMC